MQLLMGVVGMVTLILLGVLLSNNRRAIRVRTVAGAFAVQVCLGAFVLYVPAGRDMLGAMSTGVANVIAYGNQGISFMFGGLVSDKMFELFGGGGFVFALRVLPVIVFFSSLIAVLYYLGIMQLVIRVLGVRCTSCWAPPVPSRCRRRPISSSVRPKRRWWYAPISPP